MDTQREATGSGFVILPTTAGAGCLVNRSQVVGARANGPDGGAILYTAAGPSIYTSLTPRQLGRLFDAEIIEPGFGV